LHGFRVWAGDDTKVQRNSPGVWGTCTFHDYSARCPNRASTVRAHNWVVVGALLPGDDQPALFLPVAGASPFGPAKAVVAEVEGFGKRFTLVTSAVGLSRLQVLELFRGEIQRLL
jgi:hypothetical protein